MDTTETYRKMSDCPEIQELCRWEFADRVATKIQLVPNSCYIPYVVGRNTCRVFLNIGYDMDKEVAKDLCIWLPRQDQLQEMLSIKDVPLQSVAWVGYLLCLLQYDFARWTTSMEQLWLAFVMKEKYNKVWNGDNWNKV